MERIDEKFKQIIAALNTLSEALHLFQTINPNDQLYPLLRDSVIKRFEYCTDLFWKFLKLYAEEKHGMPPISSPRGVIKLGLDIRVIEQKEYILLLEMVESRNLTSHIYHEELAEKISLAIPAYYNLMATIVNRLTPT